MSLRLEITNKDDRALLEKHGVDIGGLIRDNARKALVTLGKLEEKPSKRSKNVKTPKSKYKNTPVISDGMRFDSKHEFECWNTLKDLERRGVIYNLKRQITVPFIHNGIKIASSRPDFYFEVKVEESRYFPVYADAKSPATAKLRPFKTTQKMFLAYYGTPVLVFLATTNIEESIRGVKVGII